MLELEALVPGFAGAFFERDSLTVMLRDLSTAPLVAARTVPAFLAQRRVDVLSRYSGWPLRFKRAAFSFSQLSAEADRIRMRGWPPGATSLDVSERDNKVMIGVGDLSAVSSMRTYLAKGGADTNMVDVEVLPLSPPLQGSLRDYRRPVIAGIEIATWYQGTNRVCTLGYNVYRRNGAVVDSSKRYFLTASHCTGITFGTDGSPFYQDDLFAIPDSIATEVLDPPPFTGNGCPPNRQCRWSEAVLAQYRSNTSWQHGYVAASSQTSGSPPPPPPFLGTWTFNIYGSNQIQQAVYKTGRSTGTTSGYITHWCYDMPFNNGPVTLRCQHRVAAPAFSGDSGGPAYFLDFWGGWYVLVPFGVLHSGDATAFVLSTISNIEIDLGQLETRTTCGLLGCP